MLGTGGTGGLVKGVKGNLVTHDPGLDTLYFYGGPTETMALQAGSPAIDAGSASIPGVTVPTIDERGAERGPAGLDAGPNPDIGAYEASSSYLVTSTADDGSVGTLRAAIFWTDESTNANQNSSPTTPNTINFNLPSSSTINLETPLPDLYAGNIAIDGPGASSLTVERDPSLPGSTQFSVFAVDYGTTAAISGLTIAHGLAFYGGGVFNDGTLTVANCALTSDAATYGGGIWSGGTLTVTSSTFGADSATNGSGIYNVGTTTVTTAVFAGNSASYNGGGIDNNNGSVTVTNSTLSGDSAEFGGAVYNAGGATVAVTDCTLSANSADEGGGICNLGAATVANSALSANTVTDSGGAIFNSATMTVTGSTLSANSAFIGGGIENDGSLTIASSTLSANSAVFGGGIDNDTGAALIATNCTVANNLAYSATLDIGAGGGIYNQCSIALTDNTIAGNQSQEGGGIYSESSASLANTIVGDNIVVGGGSGPDFFGSVTNDLGYNLVGDTTQSSGFTGPGDVLDENPLLGPLANYGGPTETIALLPGSPAIAAGSAAFGPAIDQRGVSRPVGSAPDIGAFESQGFTISVTGGDGQSTLAGTAFALPLQVTVTSAYGEPVAGGIVTFTTPGLGSSAILSSATAIIGPGGVASVTATANATVGSYSVNASASGAAAPAALALTNSVSYPTAFSGLADQTITYGTSSIIVTGTLAAGAEIPVGDDVTVTLSGVAQQAAIGNDGSFSTTFATAALGVASSPYTISYAYEAHGLFLAANATSQLTVSPAPLTITADNITKIYGNTVTLAGSEFATSGLVNGDRVTGMTLTSAGAPANAAVGSYPIVASAAIGSGLANYSITYVNGSLTVISQPVATYTVTSALDNTLSGTLRWAITQATSVTSTAINTINFDLPSPSTINLESALPNLGATDVNIVGPGASNLTVERDPSLPSTTAFGVFTIEPMNGGTPTDTFSGLTISHGVATSGPGGAVASWTTPPARLRSRAVTSSRIRPGPAVPSLPLPARSLSAIPHSPTMRPAREVAQLWGMTMAPP